MRLSLVNPNTSSATTVAMVEIAREEAGDAEIIGYTAPFGAPLITDEDTLATAAAAVLSLASDVSGSDGVIVAAFGDPGRESLTERLTVPVTGIAEASMAEAAAGGRRFAVATTTPDLGAKIAHTAAHHGHVNFAGTWTTMGEPASIMTDARSLEDALFQTVLRAVEEAVVEAVIIGGGPLAVAARALAPRSPVPLIEPLPAAVRLALARAQRGGS